MSKGLKLKIVNPQVAWIDVSFAEMQICVPEDRDTDNNRRFGTFTEDLHLITELVTLLKKTATKKIT
jgi:hypothetical protein